LAKPSQKLNDQKLEGKVFSSELIRNMELGRFEMAFAILLPCNFTIYLNPEDHSTLSGVFPLIADDARRALRAHVSSLNAPPRFALGKLSKPAKEHKIACRDWNLEFLPDPEVPVGDIEIHSEYSETVQPGFRGTRTTLLEREPTAGMDRHGATRNTGSQNTTQRAVEASPAHETVFAEIHYQDDSGSQVYLMTRNELRIGRGGGEQPMDIALYTTDEVSREHLIIRREPATGVFLILDVSTNGTWVEGKRLTRGVEQMLPTPASIDAGQVIRLNFEARL
jgi:hypothetical protein